MLTFVGYIIQVEDYDGLTDSSTTYVAIGEEAKYTGVVVKNESLVWVEVKTVVEGPSPGCDSMKVKITGNNDSFLVGDEIEVYGIFVPVDYSNDNCCGGISVERSKHYMKEITNSRPNADFTYTPSNPLVEEPISFDASSSSDPDGSITQYSWDWDGDGNYEGTGITASHTFSNPGNYNVCLRVKDDAGATDETCLTVTTEDPSLYLKIENNNGQDVTYEPMKFGNTYTVILERDVPEGGRELEVKPSSAEVNFFDSPGDFGTYQSLIDEKKDTLYHIRLDEIPDVRFSTYESEKELFAFTIPEATLEADIVWTDELNIYIQFDNVTGKNWDIGKKVHPGISRCSLALVNLLLMGLSNVEIQVPIPSENVTVGTVADVISKAKSAGDLSKSQVERGIESLEKAIQTEKMDESLFHFSKAMEHLTMNPANPQLGYEYLVNKISGIRDIIVCTAHGLEGVWMIADYFKELELAGKRAIVDVLSGKYSLSEIVNAIEHSIPVVEALEYGLIGAGDAIENGLIGLWEVIDRGVLTQGSLVGLHSPASIEVYDTNGNVSSYSGDSKTVQIPGSEIFLKGSEVYISLPDGVDLDRIKLHGEEAGTATLDVGVVDQGFVKGARYESIDMDSSTSCELTSLSTDPQGTMKIDNDGDGSYETSKSPDQKTQNTAPDTNTSAVFRVTDQGDVLADKNFYGSNFTSGKADLAENVKVTEKVEPGDVLALNPEVPKHYCKSTKPYSDLASGVVSTQPGMTLASNDKTAEVTMALMGTVPVKATTENGPIQPGDLLTTSSKPGYAMACNDRSKCAGAIVGKALESLQEGEGKIRMLAVN